MDGMRAEDARGLIEEEQVIEQVHCGFAIAGDFGVGMCQFHQGIGIITYFVISLIVLQGLRVIFPQHVHLPQFVQALGLPQTN